MNKAADNFRFVFLMAATLGIMSLGAVQLMKIQLVDGSSYLETEILHCPECRDDYVARTVAVAERIDSSCRPSAIRVLFAPPVHLGARETAELSRRRRQ